MAEYLIQDTTLDAIANAINAKTGGSSAMTPAEMVTEIGNIPSGGGITPTGTKQISITQNGTTTEDVTQYANAEIMVNVPSGASLPSIISKIDGGSFTLASDTAGNNHWISHNLGEAPKGVIIWTDDSDLRTSTAAVAQRYLLCSTIALLEWVTGTTSNAAVPNHLFRNTNGVTGNTGSPITQSIVGNHFQTTRFTNAVGSLYYKAGVEYKWVAFA